MIEQLLLYNKHSEGDEIDNHPLNFYNHTIRYEENGDPIHCFKRIEPYPGENKEYELLYYEMNKDGYFTLQRQTFVVYDLKNHDSNSFNSKDCDLTLFTVWAKIIRYPENNMPMLLETSSKRRITFIRDNDGNLLKKIVRNNGKVSISYDEKSSINLSHGNLDIKKKI